MNQQLAAVNMDAVNLAAVNMSQYHRLILYIEYANETSSILNGEEVFTYFHDKVYNDVYNKVYNDVYNKVAMDIYNSHQANFKVIESNLEATVKWMLSWFVFYLFCRFVFYVIRIVFKLTKFTTAKPIHIILTK
jgi:hypothetical protein